MALHVAGVLFFSSRRRHTRLQGHWSSDVCSSDLTRQRDISSELIRTGALGRRRKNHAMNGHSPTLWLQDERGRSEERRVGTGSTPTWPAAGTENTRGYQTRWLETSMDSEPYPTRA